MSIDAIPTIAAKRGPTTAAPASGKTIYTCPMHPEVQQDDAGAWPKCGMALEPKTVTAGTDGEENAELRDMTRRFCAGGVISAAASWVAVRVIRTDDERTIAETVCRVLGLG